MVAMVNRLGYGFVTLLWRDKRIAYLMRYANTDKLEFYELWNEPEWRELWKAYTGESKEHGLWLMEALTRAIADKSLKVLKVAPDDNGIMRNYQLDLTGVRLRKPQISDDPSVLNIGGMRLWKTVYFEGLPTDGVEVEIPGWKPIEKPAEDEACPTCRRPYL